MANAAPFIANPIRRLAAGLVDFVLAVMSAGIISGIAQTLGHTSNQLELALIIYAIYHAGFYWLWGGQTPGLRTFDIRTVSAVGSIDLSSRQALARAGLRPLVLYLLGWASNSITPQFNIAAVIVLTPLLGELGMMFTLPSRQTLSDLASRTLVVNVPPLQPHRAPAAPMYSPTDAEFGVRPQRTK
jgi:uncharacterized RDD family membrane protein YckC